MQTGSTRSQRSKGDRLFVSARDKYIPWESTGECIYFGRKRGDPRFTASRVRSCRRELEESTLYPVSRINHERRTVVNKIAPQPAEKTGPYFRRPIRGISRNIYLINKDNLRFYSCSPSFPEYHYQP